MESRRGLGLVMKGQGVQAIYGPKADVLKSQDILDSGEIILKLFKPNDWSTTNTVHFKGLTEEVLLSSRQSSCCFRTSKDQYLLKKWWVMVAVEPAKWKRVSPFPGTVSKHLPNKTCSWYCDWSRYEYGSHWFLDTVSLERWNHLSSCCWRTSCSQVISLSQLTWMLSVQQDSRNFSLLLSSTNGDAIKSVKVEKTGSLAAKAAVASNYVWG